MKQRNGVIEQILFQRFQKLQPVEMIVYPIDCYYRRHINETSKN